jgi:hypothetical protein
MMQQVESTSHAMCVTVATDQNEARERICMSLCCSTSVGALSSAQFSVEKQNDSS